MQEKTSKWMWYLGDFELFHSHKLHARRSERGIMFPVQWFIPEVYHNIFFCKEGKLERAETICVTINGDGFVRANGKLYSPGKPVEIPAGDYRISIAVNCQGGLPCAYVEGETIKSDASWSVSRGNGKSGCGICVKAGCRSDYTDKECTPESFRFAYKKVNPVCVTPHNGGLLYDYGKEIFATVAFRKLKKDVTVYYGETDMEAVDTEHSYILEEFYRKEVGKVSFAKGFKCIYIPNVKAEDVDIEVQYEYLPVEKKGRFNSSNELLNRIWDVAAYTFELNSREFYMDGIKRDRWVWVGDAYQSFYINRYLCFDEDIAERTIRSLGGKDGIVQHLNNIVDYTLYWIISIYNHYEMTGNREFLEEMFPRMTEFVEFTLSRLDANGFINKCGNDWIFIDWAEMDKDGAVCAEQILLCRSLEIYVKCAEIMGVDSSEYCMKLEELKKKIDDYFWSEEKGAYIDSFTSGKKNVTRHANIFALLFGYGTQEQRASIIEHVIFNDDVPQITTPYFKFYELESMCVVGKKEQVLERILDYWGAMVNAGATTFWEEFTPDMDWKEQLGMYERKYGKSLCHAWGASPIYLIGRYFLGVRPTSIGYERFVVEPDLAGIAEVDAVMPVKGGSVAIRKKDERLTVKADKDGGVFIYQGKEYKLYKDTEVTVDCNE